jgi:predicted nucleic acid-binding protein
MTTTYFADTYYYLAIINPNDRSHQRVVSFTPALRGGIVTTAWVITELADALADARNRPAFLTILRKLKTETRITVVEPTADLFEEGLDLYRKRPDKDWSLTDCISFVVMQQQGLSEALTGDHHFEQAGFHALFK